MSRLRLNNMVTGAAPPAGKLEIFSDSVDKLTKTIDEAGVVRTLAGEWGLCATTAASSAINTTETIVAGGATGKIPIGSLLVGTTVSITLMGTCTASAANVSTFRVRIGTAGTTSDTQVASAVVTSATSGTAIPFRVNIMFTVRTVGASGSIYGSAVIMNQGTTGISTLTLNIPVLTVAAPNTVTANYISATYQAAATTTTCTFQNGIIEITKT